MSHELRTPLTGITTYLSLLKRGKPEKRERYLEVLEYETQRLTGLIQQMLDLSRIDSKRYFDIDSRIDPVPVLNAAVSRAKRMCEKNGRVFEASIPHELPEIRVTEHHLEQLLTNLLNNGVTFTEEGDFIQLQVFF